MLLASQPMTLRVLAPPGTGIRTRAQFQSSGGAFRGVGAAETPTMSNQSTDSARESDATVPRRMP